jgi:cytochrome c553
VSARFEHDMVVRLHMHENFGMVRAIEHLLIRNKLDEARELARGVAESPDEPGTAAWATETARVREQASAIANATTLDDAIHAVARLGARCAACHSASGTLPDLATPPAVPPDRSTIESRMARHRWATDRMWEGMIGLSDESWRAGLDVLGSAPLPATELGAAREGFARTLQRTAKRATTVKAADRGEVYGELLVVCAKCHAHP